MFRFVTPLRRRVQRALRLFRFPFFSLFLFRVAIVSAFSLSDLSFFRQFLFIIDFFVFSLFRFVHLISSLLELLFPPSVSFQMFHFQMFPLQNCPFSNCPFQNCPFSNLSLSELSFSRCFLLNFVIFRFTLSECSSSYLSFSRRSLFRIVLIQIFPFLNFLCKKCIVSDCSLFR